MAYTRTTWVDGGAPAITAANLNNIETGILGNETAVGNKVDKVAGKGLSTNDYDNTEVAKIAGKLDKSGGTMTGILTAQSNTSYATKQCRNMILSTTDAVLNDMADGDIWIKYEGNMARYFYEQARNKYEKVIPINRRR